MTFVLFLSDVIDVKIIVFDGLLCREREREWEKEGEREKKKESEREKKVRKRDMRMKR